MTQHRRSGQAHLGPNGRRSRPRHRCQTVGGRRGRPWPRGWIGRHPWVVRGGASRYGPGRLRPRPAL